MNRPATGRVGGVGIGLFAAGLAMALVTLLVLPMAALFLASSPAALWRGVRHPLVAPALVVSFQTTAVSLLVVVVAGTPLAWFLARTRHRGVRLLESLVELPIVIPPAVVGIALLMAFGRRGILGGWLQALGWSLPFTTAAVVCAQIVVSAPFFIQSAVTGFRGVDEDVLLVARSLGASPARSFFRIALPSALPSLLTGASLSWARAIGEFGATLLFAGNMPGRTQTLPLAIYAALESDIEAAQAIALLLAAVALTTLVLFRAAARPRHLRMNRASKPSDLA